MNDIKGKEKGAKNANASFRH